MQIFVRLDSKTHVLDVDGGLCVKQLSEELLRTAQPAQRDELWYQHQGRPLRTNVSLSEAGVVEGSLINAHLRVRGGGGDGGATGAESRSSYLEMYMAKKPEKVNPAEEKLARWTTCKLSGEKLRLPCVVDELGNLYNKEALVTALVTKTVPKALGHISSLKHVRDAVLTPASDAKAAVQTDSRNYQPGNDAEFCCPISGQPLNGQYRFYALLPQGHIVSEKALKQVSAAVEDLVGVKWAEEIPLNGSQEEVEALWDRLIAKRAAQEKVKKEKKSKKKNSVAVVDTAAQTVAVEDQDIKRASSGDSPTNTTEASEKLSKKRPVQDFSITDKLHAKKLKAADMAPAGADKKLWASLFTSSHPKASQETYSCRSTSGRGWI